MTCRTHSGPAALRSTLASLLTFLLMCQLHCAGGQRRSKRPPPTLVGIQRSHDILTARRTTLWRSKFPFRNVGVNIPDLLQRFLQGEDTSAVRALADARLAGVRFVRCWGTTWDPILFKTFDTDRSRWFAAFDRMLAAADDEGIAVVPVLLANIRMLPDYANSAQHVHEDILTYVTPGSVSNRLAVSYVTEVVSRYKEDPRVLFWEIGNEYNLEADLSGMPSRQTDLPSPTSDQIRAFLAQIGTVIKSVDKRHLISSGNGEMRPNAWGLRQAVLGHRTPVGSTGAMFTGPIQGDTFPQYVEMLEFFSPAPLSVLSTHQAPKGDKQPYWLMPEDTRALMVPWTARAAETIGKPLFVGSIRQAYTAEGKELPCPWIKDFLTRLTIGSVQVGALSSWEPLTGGSDSLFVLSPTITPELVRSLGTANQGILTDSIGTVEPDK